MKTYVIIPGYNEERYIADVLDKTLAVTDKIVYVDDGSVDNSALIAREKIKYVLCHKINLGKGASLKTGCEYAFNFLDASAVVFMDADSQHDPAELARFFKELDNGAQVVFGVRKYNSKMPLVRALGSRFTSFIFNVLFQQYIPDIPSGYKAITKSAYNKIKWDSAGYEIEIEIAARIAQNKISYKTIKINPIYHDLNKGMTEIDAFNIIKQLIKLRFNLWLLRE